jgi:large subunit ribosomal protein L23
MNRERLMKVLISPVISEKTAMAEVESRYGFRVAPGATKREIGRAVELMFHVKVDGVQVLNVKGKKKRFRRMGKRSDWRKAYVRLRPGHKIDLGRGA